jgi:hypothetical protein
VYVWSVSRMGWYMVVLNCVWNVVLTGVLGVLAACIVVCVRGPCGGLQVGICGTPTRQIPTWKPPPHLRTVYDNVF